MNPMFFTDVSVRVLLLAGMLPRWKSGAVGSVVDLAFRGIVIWNGPRPAGDGFSRGHYIASLRSYTTGLGWGIRYAVTLED